MNLPDIPLEFFILTPIIFILLIVFTDIRYGFRPDNYIGHGTMIASLVIGFIFLYGMQKYDVMDANVPTVIRNINYLEVMATKYDSSAKIYLIEYSEEFLNFENSNFPLLQFENKIIPLATENEVFRIREAISILNDIYHQRISKTNLIVNEIWYLVFICAFLLTVIFPMDKSFIKELDSVIVIVLIWLPVFTIYYLYTSEVSKLETTMNDKICQLERSLKRGSSKCSSLNSLKCISSKCDSSDSSNSSNSSKCNSY